MNSEDRATLERILREYGSLVEKHLAEVDKHVAEAEKYQKLIDNLSSLLEAEQPHVPEVLQQEVETYPKHWDSEPWDANHMNDYGKKLDDKAKTIRELYDTGKWTVNALSWKYQISGGEIHHILSGERWPYAGGPIFTLPIS